MPYKNLFEAADDNVYLRRWLESDRPHTEVAQLIFDQCDYVTSETSVRRWRAANGWTPPVEQPESMRILLWDIETSPNLGHVWSLWNQNIGLTQLMESGDLLCFAAKWYGEPRSMAFYSTWTHSYQDMVQAAWELLNAADAVVSYNGKHYDTPWINRVFVEQEMLPPSPYKHIDLCDVAKRQFNWPSNKLAYVAERLLGETKTHHEGHELWVKVMNGDPAAQKTMRKYNIQDVNLLEPLYDRLRPWIPSHPSYGAFTSNNVCPSCGSDNLGEDGFAYTAVGKFPRFLCGHCGKWSRASKRVGSTGLVQIAG